MVQLNPYLSFMGKTEEAMKFYQSVLGGELKLQTYGETKQSKSPDEENLIMHAELKNDMLMFMASDGTKDHPVKNGGNSVQMSLSGDDVERLTKYFNGLAEGGNVEFPLTKQFWGDTFGMLTDKFGIHWMIDISSKEN